jgi:hypothetical protein
VPHVYAGAPAPWQYACSASHLQGTSGVSNSIGEALTGCERARCTSNCYCLKTCGQSEYLPLHYQMQGRPALLSCTTHPPGNLVWRELGAAVPSRYLPDRVPPARQPYASRLPERRCKRHPRTESM